MSAFSGNEVPRSKHLIFSFPKVKIRWRCINISTDIANVATVHIISNLLKINFLAICLLAIFSTLNGGGQCCVFEGGPVDVFTMVKNLDYPRDGETRNITAAIHPRLQDRDFCLLHPGEPLFQTFSGETMKYQGDEALYAFFINECAYYEKGIALSLARKRRVTVPSIRVQTDEEERASEESFASEEEE